MKLFSREAPVKCVLVGEANAEKTKLIKLFIKEMSLRIKNIDQKLLQGVDVDMVARLPEEQKHSVLKIFDTSGLEDLDLSRPIVYKNAKIVLLCFSLIDPHSFEKIKQKWFPEIQLYAPNTPFILVGVQSDLRDKLKKKREEERLAKEESLYREEQTKRDAELRNKMKEMSSKAKPNMDSPSVNHHDSSNFDLDQEFRNLQMRNDKRLRSLKKRENTQNEVDLRMMQWHQKGEEFSLHHQEDFDEKKATRKELRKSLKKKLLVDSAIKINENDILPEIIVSSPVTNDNDLLLKKFLGNFKDNSLINNIFIGEINSDSQTEMKNSDTKGENNAFSAEDMSRSKSIGKLGRALSQKLFNNTAGVNKLRENGYFEKEEKEKIPRNTSEKIDRKDSSYEASHKFSSSPRSHVKDSLNPPPFKTVDRQMTAPTTSSDDRMEEKFGTKFNVQKAATISRTSQKTAEKISRSNADEQYSSGNQVQNVSRSKSVKKDGQARYKAIGKLNQQNTYNETVGINSLRDKGYFEKEEKEQAKNDASEDLKNKNDDKFLSVPTNDSLADNLKRSITNGFATIRRTLTRKLTQHSNSIQEPLEDPIDLGYIPAVNGKVFSREIGAKTYIETTVSRSSREGVRNVFDRAIVLGILEGPSNGKSDGVCVIQ